MAEENLHDLASLTARLAELLAVLGLDELADDRNFQRPHQVRHEHERILEHRQRLDRLPLVIVGDVACQLFHPLLDLLRRNYLSQWLDFRRIHEVAMPPATAGITRTITLDSQSRDARSPALQPPKALLG